MITRIGTAYQLYMIEHGEPKKIYLGYAQRTWLNHLRETVPTAPAPVGQRAKYGRYDIYLVDDKDYIAFGP